MKTMEELHRAVHNQPEETYKSGDLVCISFARYEYALAKRYHDDLGAWDSKAIKYYGGTYVVENANNMGVKLEGIHGNWGASSLTKKPTNNSHFDDELFDL